MSRVTIVIPCYNEEQRLPVKEFQLFLSGSVINFLFVNDGSKDGTLSMLEGLRKTFPSRISVLDLERNCGKAEAVRLGMVEAAKGEDDDIIGFMDADLSTPLEEIDYFLKAFEDDHMQFVFGSRILRIGAQIDRFRYRFLFGRVIATLVSQYLRIPVYDSQCGAKFFHAAFARNLFATPFVSRWLFDVEIFRRIALTGRCVEDCALELPLHTWIEKGGSKIRVSDYFRLPFEFYKIYHHYAGKKTAVPAPVLQPVQNMTIRTVSQPRLRVEQEIEP